MNYLPNELAELLNRYSAENESDTPDFILSSFMLGVLKEFNRTVKWRTEWYSPEGVADPSRTE